MNASLLQDEELSVTIREFWSDWQSEKSTFPSLATWWNAGKVRLKYLIRQFSRRKPVSRRARIRSLENKLYHLHRREANGDDVSGLIKETKDQLELEHLPSAEGARIRTKEQWAEEGESSSAYFLRQEKVFAHCRLFTGICDAQSVVVRSVSAIIRVWCLFYIQLFTATVLSSSDQPFFFNVWIVFVLHKKHLFVRATSRLMNVFRLFAALRITNLLALMAFFTNFTRHFGIFCVEI